MDLVWALWLFHSACLGCAVQHNCDDGDDTGIIIVIIDISDIDDDLLKVGGSRVLVEPNSLWSNLPKVSLMMMMIITSILIILITI